MIPDLILICQSNIVDAEAISKLPLDRLDMFSTLVYPRMVRHRDRFMGHLDLIDDACGRPAYADADYVQRRQALNIWHLPSMGGAHLANLLAADGLNVALINNIDSEWDRFAALYASCSRPPLVGLSTTFYLTPKQVAHIAKMLLRLDPEMEIVAGGAFINSLADRGLDKVEGLMRRSGLTYALHAFNSEPDLRAMLLARKAGVSITDIPNLCILKRGGFTTTGSRWNEPLLGEVPALWDKLDLPFLNRTIQIRTAAGCPFSCAFCSYPTTARSWQTLDADLVRTHLDAISRMPGVRQIIFIDDTFNVPRERFKALLQIFCEYDFEWYSFLRVQFVDDEIVRLMKQSGCCGVYLGIESASDTVLANMNKKATSADFARGIELLAKHGIASLAAFVLGFPGETDETLEENIRFIEKYPIDYYSLKEFFYMENTKVHADREKWRLTGGGANWTHATMDYQTASQRKLEMFRTIRNRLFIDPDTSLWYLAYLRDQGLSNEGIRTIQGEINTIMRDQLDGRFEIAPERLTSIREAAQR
ncbi:radical SAM protein [Telmatospirillum siberiense]|uniref:Radical SAM core domain-containing protein n=1 Tax=Telmatospirillum siberiense TaxID=382514 RepID=A0A2N3PYB4_9PROT|nr:radical SAM protein [Telmatospirillum siberiense]PKU25402.1 hypothetical protein CWS72_07395 [Telmatospirillum siberiense]